ncbi:MAG: hypothetical protein HC819_14710 [Cyclobacteriaceae bacterium]|nr:hypothetical protein [Cyclobacteriaceae bacterium]
MKTFDFITDQLPFGYAYNFDNYLFNKIKHINTQGIAERADYFIINNIKKRIEGKIHFLLSGHTAYSPYRSLFGSFEFSPRLHPNLLPEFWEHIQNDLHTRGISQVKITNYAGCYAPRKVEIIKQAMEKSGFSVVLEAVNHHIDINENPLTERMHPMEVRRLSKSINEGFTFHHEDATCAEEIYDYLGACRGEQGLELSITKAQLLEYLSLFPQHYLLFSIRHRHTLMAATVAVKVHKQILYNFLPGSLQKHKTYSPAVMLNEGLYRYAREHQFELLDLGISTEKDGTNQASLIEFKERIGGVSSAKYFFEKRI